MAEQNRRKTENVIRSINGGYSPDPRDKPLSEGYQPKPSTVSQIKPPPPPKRKPPEKD
jgi:hypothetical protein